MSELLLTCCDYSIAIVVLRIRIKAIRTLSVGYSRLLKCLDSNFRLIRFKSTLDANS